MKRRPAHSLASSAEAIHATRILRPGWTADRAADWMLALTHVDLWQHLVVESGWSPDEYVKQIVSTLRQTLLRQ